ncbi:hypothetical protein EFD56_14830 [Rhizobium phaseoli]|uniref:hypothetical protein n=1 Tax=Rhizobium phaseoli TaxID=396 RepID=UPI000F881DDE|nr:hypothetical protein [Rhizobium phaseoli]RUM18722.1 hypothetical protein EFD56_14830 [Rhizobium phaseoli]
MTVYRGSGKCLRDYQISVDEAARVLHVTAARIRTLSREGYIKPGRRKGFYRLGDVIDGHAEAVMMGVLARPLERANCRPTFACPLEDD